MIAGLIQLAVLISGGGTTLQNLIDQIAAGKLKAKIQIVIASRPGIAGIEKAKKAGLKCEIIERKSFETSEEFSRAIFAQCKSVDLICLAGWLSYLNIPPEFASKIMNIHPSLLPAFGGHGMYGSRVHKAVLASGHNESGCTVHFVDSGYDTGPIILQRRCRVLANDTPETLAHRVFDEEKIAYPEAIEMFRKGRIEIRPARREDLPAIIAIHIQAFGGRKNEANLVELLYAASKAEPSLVAQIGNQIVGHVIFSPVTLESADSQFRIAGLGPIAVLPTHQRQGIGSRLISEGLSSCRVAGFDAVVVLGDPAFYSRFGFIRASEKGIGNDYRADDHFMVLELRKDSFSGRSVVAKYAPEFKQAGC